MHVRLDEMSGGGGISAFGEAEPRPETEPRRKLVWLAAIRIVVITFVLAGGSYFYLLKGGAESDRAIAVLTGLVLALNLLQIAIALLLRGGHPLARLARIQVVGDLAFALSLVAITGVDESLFSFLLPLVAVSGGSLLGERGAWVAAFATLIGHALLLLLVQQEVLVPWGFSGPMTTRRALQALFVHGSAILLTAGLMAYVLSQARRAGERAEAAENVLARLHVLHDAIVRSIGSGILTTDRQGRISFVNPAGEEILEQGVDALRGRPLAEIFPASSAEGADAPTPRSEAVWRTPSGKERLLGFAVTPLRDPAGRRIGSIVVFQDLTELRALEERAARSERLALVGELAAGLAHELRNPLASIFGAIEMLAQEGGADDQPLYGIVLRETERLNRLVTEFLAFATPSPPRLAPVEIAEMLRSTLEVFSLEPAARGLRIESRLEPCWALADEDQMRQVVWNLLLNAAQASREGGRITVACAPEGDDAVLLYVEDEGCGIPAHMRDKIFAPFFTTKEAGSGLGLPMVHRVVESLGGDLALKSEEGVGTRFSIRLQRAEAPAHAAVEGRV